MLEEQLRGKSRDDGKEELVKKNIKPVLCLFGSLGNSLLNEPCYLLSQDSKYPLYKQLLLALVLKDAENPSIFNHCHLLTQSRPYLCFV